MDAKKNHKLDLEIKKKNRLLRYKNGVNYSLRTLRAINSLTKSNISSDLNDKKSINNIKKYQKSLESEVYKTKLVHPDKGVVWNHENLEFVPFLQERDGMGKIITNDNNNDRKVKIIRYDSRNGYREKESFLNNNQINSLTNIIYEGVLNNRSIQSSMQEKRIRTNNSDHEINKTIIYKKFEKQKQFEPLQTIIPINNNKKLPRQSKTTSSQFRKKIITPSIGSYDYSSDAFLKAVSRNITFNKEKTNVPKEFIPLTPINISEAFQNVNKIHLLVEDFSKQIGREQTQLKWAPAIHEKEKMKSKQKAQEFKEIDSKDLEKEYHFNRYLQKKYIIKGYVPLLSHNVKKCAPLTKDIIDEKTTKLIQNYTFNKSVQELKRIFKVYI